MNISYIRKSTNTKRPSYSMIDYIHKVITQYNTLSLSSRIKVLICNSIVDDNWTGKIHTTFIYYNEKIIFEEIYLYFVSYLFSLFGAERGKLINLFLILFTVL